MRWSNRHGPLLWIIRSTFYNRNKMKKGILKCWNICETKLNRRWCFPTALSSPLFYDFYSFFLALCSWLETGFLTRLLLYNWKNAQSLLVHMIQIEIRDDIAIFMVYTYLLYALGRCPVQPRDAPCSVRMDVPPKPDSGWGLHGLICPFISSWCKSLVFGANLQVWV